jgi:excisionase family DNA binding protein
VTNLRESPDFLTVNEAAERRRCSVYTIRRAIKDPDPDKRLVAVQTKPGAPYGIRPEDLERWIDATIVEPELLEEPRRARAGRSPLPPTRGSLRHLMEHDDQEAAA